MACASTDEVEHQLAALARGNRHLDRASMFRAAVRHLVDVFFARVLLMLVVRVGIRRHLVGFSFVLAVLMVCSRCLGV